MKDDKELGMYYKVYGKEKTYLELFSPVTKKYMDK